MPTSVGNNKIRVNVDFRGPWDVPFIKKKFETFYMPAGATIETLMKLMIDKYGDEFKKISVFCNAIVDGKMVTPNLRTSVKLVDGEWIKFVFGMDGG